jgi:transposase
MKIVAGVDCHKSSHTVVFIDAVGKVQGNLTFPTTTEGYEAVLSEGQRLGCSEWGVEGSGLYGYALAVHLAATGVSVFEVPGIYTKRNRRSSSRRGKSDVNDAKAIAETVLREHGRLSEFCLATVQRALRMRYDQRDRFVRERTNAANRLRATALLLGISELPADITPTRKAKNLAHSATRFRQSGKLSCAMEAALDEIEDAAETIVLLNQKIKDIESIIRPLVRDIAPELLDVHGISDVAAAGFIGHAGDLSNVRNASSFAMKCGTAPIECSSGRRESVRVNLGGDRQLNRLLHTAAMSQVRRSDHVGRSYYDRKRSEGKTHLEAMRCLKRTLTTIVYYRLREADKRLRVRAGHPLGIAA